MNVTTVGINLAKSVFSVHEIGADGKVRSRHARCWAEPARSLRSRSGRDPTPFAPRSWVLYQIQAIALREGTLTRQRWLSILVWALAMLV